MFDPTAALEHAISRGEIDVPPYPSVAQRLRELVRGQRYNLEQLSDVIRSDAALSARILGVANSAAHRPTNGEVASLAHAVSLLGTDQIAQLALSAAVSDGACADGPLRALRYLVWKQSLCTAFMSQALAPSRQLDSEAAFLCGLLGGLARTVTLACLERAALEARPVQKLSAEQWLALINAHEREVGRLIAQKWQLPSQIRQVVSGSPRGGGPPSRTSIAMFQLVTTMRSVVELIDRSPTIDAIALAELVPESAERHTLVELIRTLPSLVEPLGGAAPEREKDVSSPPARASVSLLAPGSVSLPGVLHVVSYTAHIIKAKQSIELEAIRLGASGAVLVGASLPTNWMTKLKLECAPEPVELWANVKSCVAVDGVYRSEIQPFGLSGEPQRQWSNAVAHAAKSADAQASASARPVTPS
jgi:HD-like signal output (HDOD) protein